MFTGYQLFVCLQEVDDELADSCLMIYKLLSGTQIA